MFTDTGTYNRGTFSACVCVCTLQQSSSAFCRSTAAQKLHTVKEDLHTCQKKWNHKEARKWGWPSMMKKKHIWMRCAIIQNSTVKTSVAPRMETRTKVQWVCGFILSWQKFKCYLCTICFILCNCFKGGSTIALLKWVEYQIY